MKKLFFIVLAFAVLNSTQADAACRIEYSGSYNGSTSTNETSRTQQATEEAFLAMRPSPTHMSCDDALDQFCCSYYPTYPHNEFTVCQDGNYAAYIELGTWDVVCDTTTTTTLSISTTSTISTSSTTTTIPPTLIELEDFTAYAENKKITLNWSTASEIDNAGFNIYRSTSEDGPYIKVNAALIPADGFATQGASYDFADKNVKLWKTYYYRLEDIDLNGTSTMHGSVSATPRLLYMFQ